MVTEAELLGLGIETSSIRREVLRRLSSCSRPFVSLGEDSTKGAETGAW